MSNVHRKRTRGQRVVPLDLPPGLPERILLYAQQGEVLLRIGILAVATLFLWGITAGWAPPFPWRTDYTPQRDIVVRWPFKKVDEDSTREARKQARSLVRSIYIQDPTPIEQLKSALKNRVAEIATAPTLADLPPGVWNEFSPPPLNNVAPPTPETQAKDFQLFHAEVDEKREFSEFEQAIDRAFAEIEQKGLLRGAPTEGNQAEIEVYPVGDKNFPQIVTTTEVQEGAAAARLHSKLREQLGSAEVAQRVFFWLRPKLPFTLKLDSEATRKAQDEAEAAVKPVDKDYAAPDVLAKAGEPISAESLALLELEHQAMLAQLTPMQKVYRSLASLGMYVALYVLSAFYICYRDRRLVDDLRRFLALVALFVSTVALSQMASGNSFRGEVIPLMLFGMTVAITYNQELALLLASAVTLIVVITLGHGLAEFVILLSAVAAAVVLLRGIRTRSKLIFVGLTAGVVALMTSIGVNILVGQPANQILLFEAARIGLWAFAAGFLMQGLLPFIEKVFDVLTDISLLEIGDVAHPLLQELVRRAPGTYNHSINVASIGEAAADAIGARGLLVRVGAYFHDIGKMLKPGYFVENQGQEANRHESLLPAMSTLIIIAHIKDGADLARQHHLPQPIIDFIQQHHGTTLVEYFYRRASEQSPSGTTVDESAFRYPGPRPQTKEAAVLMLSDAVESASRVLVEPTPARIEGLVHDIAMKRLLDGQFDESGLTLRELAVVEESLVKSLTAVYHGRVKYPEQQRSA